MVHVVALSFPNANADKKFQPITKPCSVRERGFFRAIYDTLKMDPNIEKSVLSNAPSNGTMVAMSLRNCLRKHQTLKRK